MSVSADHDPQLLRRVQALFEDPRIQGCNWQPRLFWHPTESGGAFGAPRVDPRELEVFLATVAGEASQYLDALETDHPGRGRFLAANARRHELPLFTRV